MAPLASTAGSELQGGLPQQATEGKETSGENVGKYPLNTGVDTLTRKTTTAGAGEWETMKTSVECEGQSNIVVVSGATIEHHPGSNPTLDKASPPTTVAVPVVPETRYTEMSASAPLATTSIAATAESSPMLLSTPNDFVRTLSGLGSNQSGLTLCTDAQVLTSLSVPDEANHSLPHLKPHPNLVTGELVDGASVAHGSPDSGKHPRSPTLDGNIRKVLQRKSSSDLITERQQDLPAIPVLSNITQLQTPAVNISLVSERGKEYDSVEAVAPSPSRMSTLGRVSSELSIGLVRTNSSLGDMDISHFSKSPPPIVVLKTVSDGSTGTSPSDSRSVSPSSGQKTLEARTETGRAEELEDEEMVDELAPLFGKDMRVLSMFRPYDIPGEFTMEFFLVDADYDKISTWVRAPETLECVFVSLRLCLLIPRFFPPSLDISQARCISLACYSVQDLEPHAIQQDGNREHWFESARPVSWTKIPRHMWFLVNDEFTILYPPYEVSLFCTRPLTHQSLIG